VLAKTVADLRDAGPLDQGHATLRALVLDVARAGLLAADPAAAVTRLVSREGDLLRIGTRTFDLRDHASVVVLGAGKATMPIAAALEEVLGERMTRGLVVRRPGDPGELHRVEVHDADHPLPGETSLAAGRLLLETAASCGPRDLVITAFTGGSSALVSLAPEDVGFAVKRELHRLLLDSGATIEEINAVRKHVSQVKGGRLAAAMPGATLVNLTVSDVVGDAPDLLCDAVVQDTTTPEDARAVLLRHGLWERVAPEVRQHLASPAAHSPRLDGRDITTHVLVTGASALAAMAERVRERGLTPVSLGAGLEGEARSLGAFLGALAKESVARGTPFAAGSVLIGAGGEATVSIRRDAGGRIGSGGPNQEVALGFARAVRGASPVAAVFIDSDGVDGGTHAAGGCVDSETADCAERIGLDLALALAEHDACPVLEKLGALVVTGPTGTNISDLIVIALGDSMTGAVTGAATGSAEEVAS
jgi:hydroxypyruvate reductase/glycerate 2-kinase